MLTIRPSLVLRPLLSGALVLLLAGAATAQKPTPANTAPLAPNAPADRPVQIGENTDVTVADFDRRIAPAVKKALATLPQAKRRFLKGLPEGQVFFLSTRIKDPDGTFEQVFVRVQQWSGAQVQGTIANALGTVKTYQQNQLISFPESEVLDWTISRPDGSEEGNYVGKLLDTWTN
jgi:uncharacterized protein YegJ (DUF2314 family)